MTNLISGRLLVFVIFIAVMVFVSGVYARSENSGSRGGSNSGRGNSENVVVGNVEDVKNNEITLEDKKGKGKVDKQTEIIHQNRGKGGINSIKKEDKVALISDDDEEGTEGGKAKRLVRVFVKEASAAAQSKRRAVHGVITKINGLTLTIAHQTHRERIYQVTADAATVIKLKGVQDAIFSSLQVGQRIAAVGDLTSGGGILAKRIHVIPGKAKGIFRRFPVATSSAQPSASASATPTASASATPEASSTPEPSP